MDMLGLLRAGLTEQCTIQTLQVEWNPLEVTLDPKELQNISEMSHDQLDNLERDRDKRDAQRRLRIFRELLLSTFGSLDAAFEQLKASKLAGDTGELTATQWNELLEEKVKI